MAVCCEVHPKLGTEPQYILTDGMYLVMLSVGAVRPNTWKRQFQHLRDIDGLVWSDRHEVSQAN